MDMIMGGPGVAAVSVMDAIVGESMVVGNLWEGRTMLPWVARVQLRAIMGSHFGKRWSRGECCGY
jgi:hypothetical protein